MNGGHTAGAASRLQKENPALASAGFPFRSFNRLAGPALLLEVLPLTSQSSADALDEPRVRS